MSLRINSFCLKLVKLASVVGNSSSLAAKQEVDEKIFEGIIRKYKSLESSELLLSKTISVLLLLSTLSCSFHTEKEQYSYCLNNARHILQTL